MRVGHGRPCVPVLVWMFEKKRLKIRRMLAARPPPARSTSTQSGRGSQKPRNTTTPVLRNTDRLTVQHSDSAPSAPEGRVGISKWARAYAPQVLPHPTVSRAGERWGESSLASTTLAEPASDRA